MWEFSVCFYDKIMAENFAKYITPFIRSKEGIVILVYPLHFTKVLFAVPKSCQEDTFFFIREKIAECILTNFKKTYILKNLNFNSSSSTCMKVFLQALVCFDSEVDKRIIVESLDLKDSLCVDSFVDFRLSFLKKKWDELICLANENIMYILSEDSFIEFTKFLISNLDHRCYAVNVFSKKNCYLLCDIDGHQINDFLLDKSIAYDDNKLLTSLIALNPEKIILHCNPFLKDHLLKTLYDYFNDRIELCK